MLYKTLAFIAVFNSCIGAIVIAHTIKDHHNAYKQEVIRNLWKVNSFIVPIPMPLQP